MRRPELAFSFYTPAFRLYSADVRPRYFILLSFLTAFAAAAETRLSSLERLKPEHLKATHEARLAFQRDRISLPNLGVYQDFRAVIHVHAEDAPHTKGTRPEVLQAAQKAGVQVVMFTDHGGPKPETWRGLRDGILFFAGEENGGAGLLRFPAESPGETEFRFLSHIEERYDAPSEGFAGMEICNRHTDAKLDTGLQIFLAGALANGSLWSNVVENFQKYPDEFFGAGCDYRAEIVAKWDKEAQKQHFTGIGANDSHQNQIFKGVTFDPYEVSFRNLSTHILARELTEHSIRESLREGRAYVSHDWLCDPTGFAFGAANNLGVFTMGDSVPLLGTTRVVALTPLAAHLKLFHNGTLAEERVGTNLTFTAKASGAYRLEAWLTVDGEERPWIYSNPVYLRVPALAELMLPSNELAENVEAKRNITYVDGAPDDAGKHQLDIYIPRGAERAPVFFFIHGGAWKSGDRSQYPAVANRFAKEGIITVVPSYRLAPKHPHPAQIEDVAAAFAWVARHIAEFHGDPRQIYVGGHSAGGHLAALLTLNESYLKKHGLARSDIRGAIALSGVYNLAWGDTASSVFGSQLATRREASPFFYVSTPAPPFLVSYCQWDYLTLPAQARQFYGALRKSGIEAELVYVPGESHISEMVHVPKPNDPTALAIVKFIRGNGKVQNATN